MTAGSTLAQAESGADFLVRRDDLGQARVEQASYPLAVQESQILCRVERFGFTANNITYAVFGDQMGYWRFFPAAAGWGRIPVWGHARVLASGHPGIGVGERLFGYMPMSSHALFTVGRLNPDSLTDGSPHRAQLPPAYNHYVRLPAGAPRDEPLEARQALLRPLFMLSFVAADFLADEGLFGARRVILSSASSKTALGLAQILGADRPGGCEIIGLTSPRNMDFVRSTGYYDAVAEYSALTALPREQPTVFVDMAGNAATVAAVHHHFGDQLRHSCLVGATHWDQRAAAPVALPGPQPRLLFAPDRMRKRAQDWGRQEFDRRFAAQWQRFLDSLGPWFLPVEFHGAEQVLSAYRRVLAGETDPAEAYLLSL